MIFDTVGTKGNPVIVMINGSFTSGKSLIPFAQNLADGFYVVIPTYDGHHEGGGEFTTREDQASKILKYLQDEGISEVALIQGMSMGAEVALDLAAMIYKSDSMNVKRCLFDGGPYFNFNPLMRKIMQKKFLKLIHDCQHGTADEIIEKFSKNKFIVWVAKGEVMSYNSMIEGVAEVSRFMSDKSIANESDACYTFDFPEVSSDEQKKYYFTWSDNEPAYKSAKSIKKCYADAEFTTAGSLGHGGFFLKKPEEYEALMRKLAKGE